MKREKSRLRKRKVAESSHSVPEVTHDQYEKLIHWCANDIWAFVKDDPKSLDGQRMTGNIRDHIDALFGKFLDLLRKLKARNIELTHEKIALEKSNKDLMKRVESLTAEVTKGVASVRDDNDDDDADLQ